MVEEAPASSLHFVWSKCVESGAPSTAARAVPRPRCASLRGGRMKTLIQMHGYFDHGAPKHGVIRQLLGEGRSGLAVGIHAELGDAGLGRLGFEPGIFRRRHNGRG